jgi:predicted nuclease with TOPRIM domain
LSLRIPPTLAYQLRQFNELVGEVKLKEGELVEVMDELKKHENEVSKVKSELSVLKGQLWTLERLLHDGRIEIAEVQSFNFATKTD